MDESSEMDSLLSGMSRLLLGSKQQEQVLATMRVKRVMDYDDLKVRQREDPKLMDIQ